MAKDKEKKSDDKLVLTEWQKRNIEFLKKKKQQAEEEKKLKEKLLSDKKAQQQAQTTPEAIEFKADEKTDNQETESETTSKPKKSKKVRQPKEKSATQIAFQKSLPVLLVTLLLMAVSIFMITPYSKLKDFSVKGNHRTSLEELVKASKVKASDYWLTLLVSPQPYEQAILDTNPWVKSVTMTYHFPNHFQFNVTEFEVIAYAQLENGYQPILENGKRVETVNASELPKSFLILNLEDEQAVQDLVKQLTSLPKKLVRNIKSVSLANSKTTSDLLIIEMHDGNLVRVPQSQLTLKLPYYQKLKKNLESGSIVDMEVGIYTTTADIENQPEVPVAPEQNAADKEGEKPTEHQNQTVEETPTEASHEQATSSTETTTESSTSSSSDS
ncbi:UNVERIFIED_CONTAM: cell division protein FtsQ/DivIB [Streptococcus canis]|uniref:cell division protein FtsQ/DivIB n=1 Tax=Streptococcus canis TaxID=1329 RepID=UPI001388BC7F|nr:cell division protein FtsQ/DivIB [Streptococcus canis]QKG75153.1 cell division protein FtsQ/DivIB [Streptococcus canis]GFG42400.1 cell division protein DivIB [Streptococcus canis]GMX36056.1 cell division protein FtsQ/DivIB [Streptococcus canis]GMX39888.1 cell division protein FtsQ/DivIB [Streptococcus canis]